MGPGFESLEVHQRFYGFYFCKNDIIINFHAYATDSEFAIRVGYLILSRLLYYSYVPSPNWQYTTCGGMHDVTGWFFALKRKVIIDY